VAGQDDIEEGFTRKIEALFEAASGGNRIEILEAIKQIVPLVPGNDEGTV